MRGFEAFDTCAICFCPIEPPRKRTCTNEQCIRDWTNRLGKLWRDRHRNDVRKCLECKSQFTMTPKKRTLCSKECAESRKHKLNREYQKKRRRANRKDPMTRVPFKRSGASECKICDESLGPGRTSLCGSAKCYAENKRKYLKEHYSKKWEPPDNGWVPDKDKPIGELDGLAISKRPIQPKTSGVAISGERESLCQI